MRIGSTLFTAAVVALMAMVDAQTEKTNEQKTATTTDLSQSEVYSGRSLATTNPCAPNIIPVRLGLNAIQVPFARGPVPLQNNFDCTAKAADTDVIITRFTAPQDGEYMFAVLDLGPDMIIDVLDGTNPCSSPFMTCADDPSVIFLNMTRGQSVLARVAMYSNVNFTLPVLRLGMSLTGLPTCRPVGNLVLNTTFLAPFTIESRQSVSPSYCLTVTEDSVPWAQVLTFVAPADGEFVFDAIVQGDDDVVMEVRLDSCAGPAPAGCDDDGGDGLSSQLTVALVQGQVAYVIILPYEDEPFVNEFIQVRVNSPTVQLPPQVASVCVPSSGVPLSQCNARNAALCRQWGVPLTWHNGCSGNPRRRRGQRGCQCPQFCGYTCKAGCLENKYCEWKQNKCFSRATLQQGTPVRQCVIGAPAPIPI